MSWRSFCRRLDQEYAALSNRRARTVKSYAEPTLEEDDAARRQASEQVSPDEHFTMFDWLACSSRCRGASIREMLRLAYAGLGEPAMRRGSTRRG